MNLNVDKYNWIFNPKEENIDIEEIAHNLSYLCRFGGGVKFFYSVAQHCVLAQELVPRYAKFATLLHDGAEGYIGDLKSPVKNKCKDFQKIENRLQKCIYNKFLFDYPTKFIMSHVHVADMVMLATEFRDVSRFINHRELPYQPLKQKIRGGWCPKKAKKMFLDKFWELDIDWRFNGDSTN